MKKIKLKVFQRIQNSEKAIINKIKYKKKLLKHHKWKLILIKFMILPRNIILLAIIQTFAQKFHAEK